MSFTRDRFTWLACLLLGYYAYLQAALGPLMPFLRAELRLSYTAGGLHLSAFAIGMILAGLVTDRLARHRGRAFTFWAGAVGMAAGAVLLAVARRPLFTAAGTFVMGAVGTLLLVTIQASLSDRHGERRATALTESNVVAAVFATVAPLAVGGLERAGLGWRWALVSMAVYLIVIAAAFRGTALPPQQSPSRPAGSRTHLPALFWTYWAVIVLVVAAEWCLVFWGADFLENVAGLEKSSASTTMSLFFLPMIVGRVVGSRLTRVLPSGLLLLGALAIAGVGFPLFWLGPFAWLQVVGLFLAGLGVANLFPLSLAMATTVAAPQSDAASARISLGAGLAILVVPLTVGWAADRLGIQAAYGVVAVVLAAAAALSVRARQLAGREAAFG